MIVKHRGIHSDFQSFPSPPLRSHFPPNPKERAWRGKAPPGCGGGGRMLFLDFFTLKNAFLRLLKEFCAKLQGYGSQREIGTNVNYSPPPSSGSPFFPKPQRGPKGRDISEARRGEPLRGVRGAVAPREIFSKIVFKIVLF